MLNRRSILLQVISSAVWCRAAAQDPFANSKIAALRGLSTVALVFRDNSTLEVLSRKELAAIAEVSLAHNTPDLRILGPDASSNWLELSVVSTEQGCAIEVALYRWVKISATGEEVTAKVWSDSRYIFGTVSGPAMRNSLESI